MYTRKFSRARLGTFTGLGAAALGDQEAATKKATAADKGRAMGAGLFDFIKSVLPTAGDIYKSEQQLKHQQWMIKQGMVPGHTNQGSFNQGMMPSASIPASGGNVLPMVIGLGAIAVVAVMFFGKK